VTREQLPQRAGSLGLNVGIS